MLLYQWLRSIELETPHLHFDPFFLFLVSPEMLLNQRFGAFYFGVFGVVFEVKCTKSVHLVSDFSC